MLYGLRRITVPSAHQEYLLSLNIAYSVLCQASELSRSVQNQECFLIAGPTISRKEDAFTVSVTI